MLDALAIQLFSKICASLDALYQMTDADMDQASLDLRAQLETTGKALVLHPQHARFSHILLSSAARSGSVALLDAFTTKALQTQHMGAPDWQEVTERGDAEFVAALIERGLDPRYGLREIAKLAAKSGHKPLQNIVLRTPTDDSRFASDIFTMRGYLFDDPEFGAAFARKIVEETPNYVRDQVRACCKHDNYGALVMILLAGGKLGPKNLHWFPEATHAKLSTIDSAHGMLSLVSHFGELEDVLSDPYLLGTAEEFLLTL
jgi:hypothetical protein